jgi:hypothetical protein
MSTHDEPTAPRRLRAADVIETLETALHNVTNRPTAEPSASVEITRNAKGEPQFTVKVSATASTDEETIRRVTERAHSQATQAFDALATLYPFGG